MDRSRLEALCTERGLGRESFYIHLSYSPVLNRYAPGVYAVRGADIPPGCAQRLVAHKTKHQVIRDYGWTADAKLSLKYRLSKSAIFSGTVNVPAALRPFAAGAFRLESCDGLDLGTLTIRDGRGCGLTSLFRRRGGEPGDTLYLLLDLKHKTAKVELAEEPSEDIAQQPSTGLEALPIGPI